MKQSKPYNEEGNGRATIEDINQLNLTALGEVAVVCQVCGAELREGTRLVAYAFRPAGEPTFEIGHVKCADDRYVPTECFTLGVRELIVEGRVGTCSDQAMQSSWPVLLEPQALVVSPESTTAAVPRPGVAWFRRLPEECDAVQAVDGSIAESVELRPWQRPVLVCGNDKEKAGETVAADGVSDSNHDRDDDRDSRVPDGGVTSWIVDSGAAGTGGVQ